MSTVNLTQKMKVIIDNDDDKVRHQQYNFISNSQYAQYQALNKAMGYLSAHFYLYGLNSDEYKGVLKSLTNSNPIFDGIEFGKGIDTKSSVTLRVKKDFKSALKNGLLKGERSVTNYKRTYPLITRGRDLKFSYGENGEVFIKWANGIVFKVALNNRKTIVALKHCLHKVITGEYAVAQSSLVFEKKQDTKTPRELFLNLCMKIPYDISADYEEGRVLGVDLGLAIPAYMSISDKPYVRKGLGTFDDGAKVRMQFKARRQRLQKRLTITKGGKSRKDKLKAFEHLGCKESNFTSTYNHCLSKQIVKFAKNNRCQFINLERIDSKTLDSRVLGNWTYYDLQQKIEYKAELEGITVRYVNAAYTSQRCSMCGYTDKENRKTQSAFLCKECGYETGADYNASRNIALSTEFVK